MPFLHSLQGNNVRFAQRLIGKYSGFPENSFKKPLVTGRRPFFWKPLELFHRHRLAPFLFQRRVTKKTTATNKSFSRLYLTQHFRQVFRPAINVIQVPKMPIQNAKIATWQMVTVPPLRREERAESPVWAAAKEQYKPAYLQKLERAAIPLAIRYSTLQSTLTETRSKAPQLTLKSEQQRQREVITRGVRGLAIDRHLFLERVIKAKQSLAQPWKGVVFQPPPRQKLIDFAYASPLVEHAMTRPLFSATRKERKVENLASMTQSARRPVDLNRLAEKVIEIIERKRRIERERRGL